MANLTASGFKLGRPPGAINHASRELKEFWHLFFNSEEYREQAKKRILNGSAPHLESYLLNRIYGRPKEQVEVNVVTEDLATLSTEELEARTQVLLNQLQEARELEAALDVVREPETPQAPLENGETTPEAPAEK